MPAWSTVECSASERREPTAGSVGVTGRGTGVSLSRGEYARVAGPWECWRASAGGDASVGGSVGRVSDRGAEPDRGSVPASDHAVPTHGPAPRKQSPGADAWVGGSVRRVSDGGASGSLTVGEYLPSWSTRVGASSTADAGTRCESGAVPPL